MSDWRRRLAAKAVMIAAGALLALHQSRLDALNARGGNGQIDVIGSRSRGV